MGIPTSKETNLIRQTLGFHRHKFMILHQQMMILNEGLPFEGQTSHAPSTPFASHTSRVSLPSTPSRVNTIGAPKRECRCTPLQIRNYRNKISGPLLDRIDIHIDVPAIAYKELSAKSEGTSSGQMKQSVIKARRIQAERFKTEKILANSRMNNRQVKKFCKLDEESDALLKQAIDELGLSARAYTRILKVARTIADIEDAGDITAQHISEAIQYRSLDRNSRI